MAYDKNQMVMHQLKIKAERLESGLKRIVGAIKVSGLLNGCDESVASAYEYALGCLGGDYLKKELFATDAFECVVMQLKDEKFMKSDVADKNIEVWRKKHAMKTDAGNGESVTDCNGLDVRNYVCGVDTSEKQSESAEIECRVIDSKGIEILSDTVNRPVERTMFGEIDENGEIVAKKKESVCEYATPPMVESKSGVQPSGLSNDRSDNTVRRGPIYCY